MVVPSSEITECITNMQSNKHIQTYRSAHIHSDIDTNTHIHAYTHACIHTCMHILVHCTNRVFITSRGCIKLTSTKPVRRDLCINAQKVCLPVCSFCFNFVFNIWLGHFQSGLLWLLSTMCRQWLAYVFNSHLFLCVFLFLLLIFFNCMHSSTEYLITGCLVATWFEMLF